MKISHIFLRKGPFTITEDTIFYPYCALIGPPIIWGLSFIVNPSISPIWGLSCYILFSEPNVSLYRKRAKLLITLLAVSSIFVAIAVLLLNDHFWQTIIALIAYLFYKNTVTEKLGPYLIGFVNIVILTSSPILGIVGKNTPDSIIQIVRFFGEGLVGFVASFISLFSYRLFRSLLLPKRKK